MPLINIHNFAKTPKPLAPGRTEPGIAVVGGSASVPIELHMEAQETMGAVGIDIVFLIDNSGSMKGDPPCSDPDGKRFAAIKTLSAAYTLERDNLDRIAIILFQGDSANLVNSEDPNGPWKRWSEIPGVVDELMNVDPSGATPMEAGMQRATDLLAAQNGFYKLVILLSDGAPTPDYEDFPQINHISSLCVPKACANRVLYSTVYLHLPGEDTLNPEDSALLIDIALRTDYITRYWPGDPPKYYFRIEQTAQIVQAYRELFDLTKNRRVPQQVRLVEQINPRLLIDPGYPPKFAGNGFNPAQNVIGMHLDQSLANFSETGRFEIMLNELKGEATLSFAVKLNRQMITPAEFSEGIVMLPVDDPQSVLHWLEPVAGMGSEDQNLGLPQAWIKFELGLQVVKSLQDDGSLVDITIDNLDQSPVQLFELAEHPSGFVNPFGFEDNFGFKPLAMLYENRILPWFEKLIPPDVLTRPGTHGTNFLNAVRQALRQSHAPFLTLADQLDVLLGQFSTHDIPHWADLDTFWCTQDVRGIYRLAKSLPGKASRYLRFRVRDASFVKAGQAARFLETFADAVIEKQEERGSNSLSKYKAEGWPEPKTVPNVLRGQYAYPVERPDLYVRTGLNGEQWNKFAPLFSRGALGAGNTPWMFLDSPDITPFWQNHGQDVGVDVQVHNCGKTAPAGACLRARTYFLPFTGVSTSPPYTSSPPLVGSATLNLPAIQHHSSEHESFVQHLAFAALGRLGSAAASPIPVEPVFLQQVRQVLAITVVEIDPAEGEVMLTNNRAIEITPISCS